MHGGTSSADIELRNALHAAVQQLTEAAVDPAAAVAALRAQVTALLLPGTSPDDAIGSALDSIIEGFPQDAEPPRG